MIEIQDLENHFRNVDLTIECIQQLKKKNKLSLNHLQTKIDEFKLMLDQIKKSEFKAMKHLATCLLEI